MFAQYLNGVFQIPISRSASRPIGLQGCDNVGEYSAIVALSALIRSDSEANQLGGGRDGSRKVAGGVNDREKFIRLG